MRKDWRIMPFTDAVEVNPPVKLNKGKEYPFVDMKAIEPSQRGAAQSEIRPFKSGGSRFMPYDTLMARITPCLENGKIARYVPCNEFSDSPAFGSTEFIVIRGKDGVSDNDFAYYLTQWEEFKSYAISQMNGSSGRQRVPAQALSHFTVSLPPLDQQKAIAHILGTLDDKIELNRQMNQTLEAMAQAIFKSWFIDFDPVRAKAEGRDTGLPKEISDLFPDSFQDSELGKIPKGWEVKPVGDVVECVGGATPSTKKACYWDGGTNPFLTPKDMSSLESVFILETSRHITDEGVCQISSRLIPKWSVILSSRAPIGYLTINTIPLAVNQGVIAMICNKKMPNYYVYMWLKANMDVIKSKACGTTFAEISKKNFRPISFLVPSSTVIGEFTRRIEPIFEQIVDNLISSKTLEDTRDRLLPKLLTGEIEVIADRNS